MLSRKAQDQDQGLDFQGKGQYQGLADCAVYINVPEKLHSISKNS